MSIREVMIVTCDQCGQEEDMDKIDSLTKEPCWVHDEVGDFCGLACRNVYFYEHDISK